MYDTTWYVRINASHFLVTKTKWHMYYFEGCDWGDHTITIKI
jgi:hypothetical protein